MSLALLGSVNDYLFDKLMHDLRSKKATLGDKEYGKAKVIIDYHGNTEFNYYARKIDDELMCIIMMSVRDGENVSDLAKRFE